MSVRLVLLGFMSLAACGGDNPYVEAAEKQSGGSRSCKEVGRCNGIVSVDCRSSTDGPLYYYDEDTVELINCCGGCCFTPDPAKAEDCRLNCPPPAWTCGR
jgi:hypothetical protein